MIPTPSIADALTTLRNAPADNRDPLVAPTMRPDVDKLIVGLPCAYCLNGDTYAERIVEIRRNGQVIVTNAGEYTRRRDGRYRGKGDSFGTLYVGGSWDKRNPHV